MTEKYPSIGSEVSPLCFCNNIESFKDWEKQPIVKCNLLVSEFDVKIQLVSQFIDVYKVVFSYIQNDISVREHMVTMTKSETTIEKLQHDFNNYFYRNARKPILPAQGLFSDFNNSYEIVFIECDEFAVGEVYDRLIYSMSSICDLVVSNIILANIKDLISNANPIFSNAKVARLLGFMIPVFEEQSIIDLRDICSIKGWYFSTQFAKKIYELFDKQINMLIIPSSAIEMLTADLTERTKYIIENRGLKSYKTLEELGTELGLTRERIRQIASKVERRFAASPYKVKLIDALFFTLKVLCECESCFTISELKRLDISLNALVFLSEVMRDKYNLDHVSETDCIALFDTDGKCKWLELIITSTDSIPVLLLPEEQENIIKELSSALAAEGYSIPDKIISDIAFRYYEKTGSALVKRSLRLGDRYEIVLEKFFPDGIRIYKEEDMKLFRKGYDTLFDDDRISENDHAVVARVAERCVLIDRGTYILNKRTYLPADLSQRILDYIEHYPFDMVMTNAIMHKFGMELTAIGVNNKYYLLSVLKQNYSDRFSFRRDYIIKSKNSGKFYSNITGFVESHPDGVSFHDIKTHFQGIPDAVIYFALSETDCIISMYNKMYIPKSSIIFPEQYCVLKFIQDLIMREHIVSDERVLDLLRRNYPDFIANNNIHTSWFLFSILSSFFPEEFRFSRPHIIDLSFDSVNGREALRGSFWGKKYVDISDIKKYAKEKQIQIYDLSKLLDSYNDRYFIYNKEKLISIDEIGYHTEQFTQVENIVLDAIGNLEYCELAKLNIVNSLPKANVMLTEWLIYSIINKYGTELSATTSSHQFLNSVPIVLRNSVDIETVRDDYISSGAATQTVMIDDLSDIDILVEGIINLDWAEESKR